MRRRLRLLVASEPMEYGVLSYLEHLFAGLDRDRFAPALAYSPHRMAPQAHALVARLAAEGVPLYQLPMRRQLGGGDVSGTFALARALHAFQPDVAHLHSTKVGLAGRPIARLLGIPVVYTAHGTSWRYTGPRLGRVQRALERALRPATDLLVSVCPAEAAAFADDIGFERARIRVIPNGVPLPDAATLETLRAHTRRELGLAPDAVWALFLGRMTHEKGLDVLLDALAYGAGVDGVLVVGDGADRRALEAAAARAPVPVRFTGYQADVGGLLAAADVLVQPSRSEGLPFSVLEALASGLPVLATRVGGLPALLENCGVLVDPEAPAALARTLRALVANPAHRRALGVVGRARIARDFGLDAMLASLQRAYTDVARVLLAHPVAAGRAA